MNFCRHGGSRWARRSVASRAGRPPKVRPKVCESSGWQMVLWCPTEQSSAYQYSNGGGEWLAVDGNTNQNWQGGSVTHTIDGPAPGWWRVDLESPYNEIEEVVIYGRDGCCYERLYNLRMEILDASGAVVATRQYEPANSVPTDVIFRFDLSTDDVVGKSVRVTNFNGPLSLAEVQVYGHVTSRPVPTSPGPAALRLQMQPLAHQHARQNSRRMLIPIAALRRQLSMAIPTRSGEVAPSLIPNRWQSKARATLFGGGWTWRRRTTRSRRW